MTSPRLAFDSPYGRLYRHPSTDLDMVDLLVQAGETWDAVESGILMPSVTNVISMLEKPFLQTWHGKLAAEAAVEVVQNHPGLIEAKPDEAKKWIKLAAVRSLEASSVLGNTVHDAAERLSKGEQVGPWEDKRIAGYVKSFERFRAEWNPEFLHLEATCFGRVPGDKVFPHELKYAGTADFICRIDGKVFVGDYKSGKSVHTEAGLQGWALSHAEEIVLEDDILLEMPHIDGVMVVHLAPRSYKVYPSLMTKDSVEAWDVFSGLRRLWGFHQRNLVSRAPLLMGGPLTGEVGAETFRTLMD